MKHKMIVLLTVIAFAATLSSGQQVANDTPLPELLEKAIFAEQTVGDLDAAIEMYLSILERAEADRAYVAQAQFRLGLCYAKKGQTDEAAEALRRLVTDFPKQKELVERARTRLAELGHPLPESGVVIRQIWAEAQDVSLGTVSPDGRYITFTDWSTRTGGDLMLHDFTTGRNRNLTRKTWPSSSFTEWSVISPDGKRVAYNWYNDNSYELRIVDLDGSEPRVLYADKEVVWLQAMGWSPDGKQVLARFTYRDRAPQTVLVDAESGAVRVLEKLAYSWEATFSPDGRHVVYSRWQGENSKKSDLFLLSFDGGEERPLVQHPADDRLLGWAPNGRHILFVSDRTGSWDAWALRVADGRPVGSATLVKPSLGDTRAGGGVVEMGFTREGSYYYGLSRDMSDVYFATIDPSEGGLSAAPTKVTQRFEGTNGGPDWSTDGGKIAFVSKREGSWVIVTHTVDTGEEREIPVPEFDYIGSGQHLRWSPDGRSFLVIAHRGDWRWGVFTIDSDSGSVTALAWHDPGGALLQAQWSPDGKAVFFERRADDGPRIARLDLETRKESVVYPRQVGIMVLSPDGRWVAFTTDVNWPEDEDEVPTLWVVPATGGEPRVLFRSTQSRPFHRGTPLAWTPDGRHVILGRSAQAAHPGGKGDELWKIPVEGGEPRKLGVSPTPIRHLRVHPDGKRVAFQSSTRKVEVWVMENFLPELKAEAVSELRP